MNQVQKQNLVRLIWGNQLEMAVRLSVSFGMLDFAKDRIFTYWFWEWMKHAHPQSSAEVTQSLIDRPFEQQTTAEIAKQIQGYWKHFVKEKGLKELVSGRAKK